MKNETLEPLHIFNKSDESEENPMCIVRLNLEAGDEVIVFLPEDEEDMFVAPNRGHVLFYQFEWERISVRTEEHSFYVTIELFENH